MTKKRGGNWWRIIAMILGVVLGGLWGLYGPNQGLFSPKGSMFEEVGQIYLRLLTVGVLPIILAAIGKGVGSLLLKYRAMLRRSARLLVVMLLASCALICAFGLISWQAVEFAVELVGMDRQSLGALAQKDVSFEEISFDDKGQQTTTEEVRRARDYVPQNVAEALANSYEIQLVVFSILLGLTIGLFPESQKETALAALKALEVTFDIFMALIKGLLRGLPIALFFWIASLVAGTREHIVDILQSMGIFLLVFYVVGALIVFICCLLIWLLSDHSRGEGPLATLEPVMTAFFTMNSLAAMPVAINKLQDMGYKKDESEQYMALFLPLLRFGNAMYFAVAVSFFAVVYGQNFGLMESLGAAGQSIVVSFSTIGATSVLAIQPIALIFEKFGIPAGASVTLLLAVDTLIDPMRTTLIVQCNAALTAVMSRPEK